MKNNIESRSNQPPYDLLFILRDHPDYTWQLVDTAQGPSHIVLEQQLDGEYIDKLKVGTSVKISYTKKVPEKMQLDNVEAFGVVEAFENISLRTQGDGLKIGKYKIKVKLNPD